MGFVQNGLEHLAEIYRLEFEPGVRIEDTGIPLHVVSVEYSEADLRSLQAQIAEWMRTFENLTDDFSVGVFESRNRVFVQGFEGVDYTSALEAEVADADRICAESEFISTRASEAMLTAILDSTDNSAVSCFGVGDPFPLSRLTEPVYLDLEGGPGAALLVGVADRELPSTGWLVLAQDEESVLVGVFEPPTSLALTRIKLVEDTWVVGGYRTGFCELLRWIEGGSRPLLPFVSAGGDDTTLLVSFIHYDLGCVVASAAESRVAGPVVSEAADEVTVAAAIEPTPLGEVVCDDSDPLVFPLTLAEPLGSRQLTDAWRVAVGE